MKNKVKEALEEKLASIQRLIATTDLQPDELEDLKQLCMHIRKLLERLEEYEKLAKKWKVLTRE